MEQTVHDAPDQQVSLTDPDARSMATSGKGTATVGYNVQIAVASAGAGRQSSPSAGPTWPRRHRPLRGRPGPTDRRTPVWNPQGVDGRHPLPDPDPSAR